MRCEKKRISGHLQGAFREHYCSHNAESFFIFFAIYPDYRHKKS
jgi:hypothetical protein